MALNMCSLVAEYLEFNTGLGTQSTAYSQAMLFNKNMNDLMKIKEVLKATKLKTHYFRTESLK